MTNIKGMDHSHSLKYLVTVVCCPSLVLSSLKVQITDTLCHLTHPLLFLLNSYFPALLEFLSII